MSFPMRLPSHQRIQFDKPVAVPPPKSKQPSEQKDCSPIRTTHPSPPEIDEKDARKALLGHVSNRYCYGKSAAKHMIITKMNHSSTFHYSLETFTETRQVAWTFEPYLGGHLDTSVGGIPPDPWSVSVDSPQAFETRTIHLPVPHTDCIRTCHVCGGVGRRRCYTCNGTGWETCYSCTGDGYKPHQFVQGDKERCLHCYGNGRKKCWKCNSDGMITCKVCSGTGQIRCYLKLTVNWTNHVDDFIMDQDEIPKERLKCAFGKIILDETGEQLQALSHFPHSTVTRASSNILKKHQDSYLQTEKLVVQRQRIYLIPITRVSYSWRGKSKFFWVYGTDKTIHAPDYPQKFCCDCSIS
ncbi:protein SSUH2 homolog isoform X2 [Brevipalpus obovatus]|uniref:protein SSUH2 homolog isoform X2 n=1 Tax=Brevipalpus obovatus TaxID=246614 RepID=UPI003D9E609F